MARARRRLRQKEKKRQAVNALALLTNPLSKSTPVKVHVNTSALCLTDNNPNNPNNPHSSERSSSSLSTASLSNDMNDLNKIVDQALNCGPNDPTLCIEQAFTKMERINNPAISTNSTNLNEPNVDVGVVEEGILEG